MTTERVRIGDVLTLKRRAVDPDPTENYVTIGVRSFGRGLFCYETKRGTELGRLRFFEVQPCQLIISNIKAWEGAVAVSPTENHGYLASNRFLLYTPTDEGRIDVQWAHWFFLSERGNALLQRASPGSADRNRTLGKDRFESLHIPLPPITEQRRVAKHLSVIRESISRLERSQNEAAHLDEATAESAIWRVFQQGIEAGWPVAPLGEVAEVSPVRDQLPDDQPVSWVPMRALDERTGTIRPEERNAGDVRGGYKQFRKGDVLFARITPSMQNGKCAIFAGPNSHGYGSTEFHVIRPEDNAQARWIHRFLRTREIRTQAANHFTGTAGQQRVPAEFLRRLPIPVPPKGDRIKALRKIDRIVKIGEELRERREKSSELRAAIEPAVLNQVFSSLDQ